MDTINIGKQSDKVLTERMGKAFPITSVCREDITNYLTKKGALRLTDAQMKRIASKMADIFCDCCYWEALENAVDYVKSWKYICTQKKKQYISLNNQARYKISLKTLKVLRQVIFKEQLKRLSCQRISKERRRKRHDYHVIQTKAHLVIVTSCIIDTTYQWWIYQYFMQELLLHEARGE